MTDGMPPAGMGGQLPVMPGVHGFAPPEPSAFSQRAASAKQGRATACDPVDGGAIDPGLAGFVFHFPYRVHPHEFYSILGVMQFREQGNYEEASRLLLEFIARLVPVQFEYRPAQTESYDDWYEMCGDYPALEQRAMKWFEGLLSDMPRERDPGEDSGTSEALSGVPPLEGQPEQP